MRAAPLPMLLWANGAYVQVWQKSLGRSDTSAAVSAPSKEGQGTEWGAELELHFRHLEGASDAAALDTFQAPSQASVMGARYGLLPVRNPEQTHHYALSKCFRNAPNRLWARRACGDGINHLMKAP